MKISQAESVVMDVLWRSSPLCAEDVVAELSQAQGWEAATVRTLLGRLVKKKALATKKDGRRFLYRPKIKRDDFVTTESQNLIDRFFDGRLGPLVTHFSERRKLTAKDVADLKRLVKEFEDDH
jgi:BlaI family transcriptional regulator, penicillinase repressor